MAERLKNHRTILICLALAAATLIAYEPIRHNDFVSYDDMRFITENPIVEGGLTQQSISWAFTKSIKEEYWIPLTWLSHMLDCELFGLNPIGHHLVNVLFHTLNSLLLFWILVNITRSTWASAFVAAVFALHPLQVESVAWASERKSVLSGLFWFLTIAVYVWYTKKPGIWRYISVLTIFGLSIMTKPVVVTLPLVLLLLDYWPLERFRRRRTEDEGLQKATIGRLIAEKIPLFVLSALLAIITVLAQQQGGAVASLEKVPIEHRIANMFISYIRYTGKMIWPNELAVLYPISITKLTNVISIVCMIIFVILLIFSILIGRRKKYLATGWLWFVVTLLPSIGLIQVGSQAMANRYAYLPLIGVLLIIALGAEEVFSKLRYSKVIKASGAAVILIALVLVTRIQVSYWRDSLTLFKRAIALTKNNYYMHDNYGLCLSEQGRYDEAFRHFKEAVRINPKYLPSREHLYSMILKQNKLDEAIACITGALQERNDWPEKHKMYNDLGCAYEQKGNLALAETNYRKAAEIKPDYEVARNNLCRVFAKLGRLNEAVDCVDELINRKQDTAEVHYNLAIALSFQGKYDEAARHLVTVLKMDPEYPDAHKKTGNTLLAAGRPNEAIEHLNEALRTSKDNVKVYENLGMAYTQLGKYKQAIQNWTKATELDPNNAEILNNLAWLLATAETVSAQDAERAIELSRRACKQVDYKRPDYLDTLAAAYASAGRFDDAIATANKAVEVAEVAGYNNLAGEIQERIKLYKAHRKYSQTQKTNE